MFFVVTLYENEILFTILFISNYQHLLTLFRFLVEQKYPGLCALCDNETPVPCSYKDKYWGRRGVAYCMTDCLGDVAWMRLDDWRTHEKVGDRKHFGFWPVS